MEDAFLTGSVVSTSISSIVDPLEEDIVEVISELTVSIRDLDLNMVVSLSVTTVCISLSDANVSVRVDIVTSGSNVSVRVDIIISEVVVIYEEVWPTRGSK